MSNFISLHWALLCLCVGATTGFRWSYPTSPTRSTCCKETPCYERVLTYIWDGPFRFDTTTPGLLQRAYTNSGTSRTEAIQFGREAIAFFASKYGITFPFITDEQLLDNTQSVMNAQGHVFEPYILKEEGRYRLYTAAVHETAQFYNAPILDYGYKVHVHLDFQSTGFFNQTIIGPALVLIGRYVIDQCPSSRSYGSCRHSILTPYNPRENITINYRTQAYIRLNQPPTGYFYTDCDLTHPVWGEGAAHGYFPKRSGTVDTHDGRNVLTFPTYRP